MPVETLVAILAALGVCLGDFFRPFMGVRPRTPRRRGFRRLKPPLSIGP